MSVDGVLLSSILQKNCAFLILTIDLYELSNLL